MLLIRQQKYFVLHAPRQTGKTSTLFALRDQLNASGEFRCVYVNVEVGQSAREDVAAAMRAILGQMASEAEYVLSDSTLARLSLDTFEAFGPHQALRGTLARWVESDARPLVPHARRDRRAESATPCWQCCGNCVPAIRSARAAFRRV